MGLRKLITGISGELTKIWWAYGIPFIVALIGMGLFFDAQSDLSTKEYFI